MSGRLNEKTMIPLGLAVSIALGGLSFIRTLDSQASDAAATVQVHAAKIARLEADQAKADERYERILSELGEIKTRLGIVEVRPLPHK